MSKLSMRLRELRNTKGISQQMLADYIGISKSSINMYERGEREPGIEILEALADFYNVDLDYLFGKTTTPNRYSTIAAESVPAQDENIKAAFWGGDKDLSPEEIETLWEDVCSYIKFKTEQQKQKKKE